jgi:heat shock protein HtpX
MTVELCPNCHSPVHRADFSQPWCPRCEWNLGAYDPVLLPPRGWLFLERRGHRRAFAVDQQLFDQYAHALPQRPGWTRSRVALVVISALLMLAFSAAFVAGSLMVFQGFPRILVGLCLLVLAFWLRPNVGRAPRRKGDLRRDQAPSLWGVVDKVAQAAGTQPPHRIILNLDYNASVGRPGLRNQRILWLGVPLWLTLAPQMRIALLAHEFGHEVNGDPNRGLLVSPALDTFRRWAQWTGADRTLAYVFDLDRDHRNVLQVIFELLLWAVSRVFLLIHLGLLAIGLHDHQRAEYLADGIAAQVAGTEATVGLLDRLVLDDDVQRVVGYGAETQAPLEWAEMVDRLQESRQGLPLNLCRQLSIRSTDLWSSHPPSGMRARMVESRAREQAQVSLSSREWSRIDHELLNWYAAAHAMILGTRDFRPEVAKPGA